jgi:acetyl-CoA acetyltransferase
LSAHPYRDVAIAGVFNTKQARRLDGETTMSVQLAASMGVLGVCGADRGDVDGVVGQFAPDLAYRLGVGPVYADIEPLGISGVMAAADAIAAGHCETVLVVGGWAGLAGTVGSADQAVLHRAGNEFVTSVGMFTAVEFALIARRHMEIYGTKPEHLAQVSSIIRNNGHINPEAAFFGRGPVTTEDVLASRMVADPFHLLDCAVPAEGACALLVTTAARARDLKLPPVYMLGAQLDYFGAPYTHSPSWDHRPFNATDDDCIGLVGGRAARQCFDLGGIKPQEVDVLELYDPFSFEIIRQFEAFGFCGPGEGGDFVMDGNMNPSGRFPTNTDGGLLSYCHNYTGQTHQKVGRCVQQLQGLCITNQVPDAELALCSNGGAGASWCWVALLGSTPP